MLKSVIDVIGYVVSALVDEIDYALSACISVLSWEAGALMIGALISVMVVVLTLTDVASTHKGGTPE